MELAGPLKGSAESTTTGAVSTSVAATFVRKPGPKDSNQQYVGCAPAAGHRVVVEPGTGSPITWPIRSPVLPAYQRMPLVASMPRTSPARTAMLEVKVLSPVSTTCQPLSATT